MNEEFKKHMDGMMEAIVADIADDDLEREAVCLIGQQLLDMDEDEKKMAIKLSKQFRKLLSGNHSGVGAMAFAHAMSIMFHEGIRHDPQTGGYMLQATMNIAEQMRLKLVADDKEKNDA